MHCGIPYHEEIRGKGIKCLKFLIWIQLFLGDIAGLLVNLKRCEFDIFSLTVVVACVEDNIPNIFLTRTNQHTQEMNRNFEVTLNNFGPMVFAKN